MSSAWLLKVPVAFRVIAMRIKHKMQIIMLLDVDIIKIL